MWNLYQQVCREEQPLWRWPGVKAGGRWQQVVQSFPSSVAQVVEWTRCFGPCSAGGAGRAEHQPGLSQHKQIESILPIFEIFCGDPRQVFFSFCSVVPVSGHAVEAWHGSELWHLPISKLPIRVSATENLGAFWTDLSQVFWDDCSTVPGLYVVMST